MAQYTIRFKDGRESAITGATFAAALAAHAAANGNSLKGLDLSGTQISGLSLRGVDLSGVVMDKDTNLANGALVDCNLTWARIDGANLSGVALVGSRLRNATIKRTSLEGAVLDMADFRGATLKDVNFEKAVWDVTKSTSPDLRTAFDGAMPGVRKHLTGAAPSGGADSFEGAQLSGGKFEHYSVYKAVSPTLHGHSKSLENTATLMAIAKSKPVQAATVATGVTTTHYVNQHGLADTVMNLADFATTVGGKIVDSVTKAPAEKVADGVMSWQEALEAPLNLASSAAVDTFAWLQSAGVDPLLAGGLLGAAALTVWSAKNLMAQRKYGERATRYVSAVIERVSEAVDGSDAAARARAAAAAVRDIRILAGDTASLTMVKGYLDEAARVTGQSLPGQHRVIKDGPGALMVCTKDNLSEALRIVARAAQHGRLPGEALPVTLFIAENATPGAAAQRPAWLTVRRDGGMVVAWAGAAGTPERVESYGPGGAPECALELQGGAWQPSAAAPASATAAADLFALQLEEWNREQVLEHIREVDGTAALRQFDYNPVTHFATRSADGVFTVRDRATGEPGNPGNYAVWGTREDEVRVRVKDDGAALADHSWRVSPI